jgi:hypothetical protein
MATKPRTSKQQLMIAGMRSRPAPLRAGARLRERDPKQRQCLYEECGRTFRPTREWQRFCSTRCRYRMWNEENPRVRIRQRR